MTNSHRAQGATRSGGIRASIHALLAFALLMLGTALLPAPPATAVAYGGAVAAPWPASFNDYTYASGAAIGDVNDDMNPAYLDIASGPCAGCAGLASSVSLQSDGVNAFFRVRLGTDLTDATKGGLFGGAFLTQIAVNGVVKAVVGVNGKTSSADVVYASDSVGGVVTNVYEYPWTGDAAGVRVTSTGDGTGQFFLDYQVPLSVILTVSGGTITPTTPIQLYYGSSAAANLAVINKDFMLGDVTAVDFTNLATVRFVPLTYTVAFDTHGGTAVASQSVTDGDPATEPVDPTRTGYTFDGWYDAATGGTVWDFTDPITGPTTIHAQWTVIPAPTYTVSFDTHGGTAVADQTVTDGDPATEPVDPTRTGYTFDGWYDAATGGTVWDFTDPITGPTTIHAQWTVIPAPTYTVSFDTHGGTAVADQTVTDGDPATEPVDPTRTGYTFDGWYDAATGGTVWDFTDPITGPTTIHAQWTVIPAPTYTVSFDTHGGTAVADQTVTDGDPATEPVDPTRTGYTFDGWYDAATGGTVWDFTDPITGPTTIHAQWTLIPAPTYTVSFDTHGGTAVADQTVTDGDPATEPVDPTRTGYTFDGWYDAATGGTVWDFTDPITGPTTIHAQWTLIPAPTYTVSFDTHGGTAVADQTVTDGDPATEPVDPTRTGYTFDGWYDAATGGTVWDFTDPITGPTTIHAQWTLIPAPTYTVSFDTHGGTAVADQTVTDGDPATEPVDPTRTGYTFDGWYDAATGGTVWDFTDPITGPTTIHAQWTLIPAPTYTVSFDTHGGTAVADQTVTDGDPATEPVDPTRTGYTFDGWYDAATGGTVWDFTDPITGPTTIHAQWTLIPAPTYTVSFDTHGGTAVADQTVTDGDPATEPVDPTRTGYTFDGWYDAATGGTVWDFTDPITGPTTIHAQWTLIPAPTYTVSFDTHGGTAVASQSVTDGDPATEPVDPTRTGYTFDGWYDAATGGTVWDFTDPITGPTTIHAQWTLIPAPTYTVSFDTHGGTAVADQTVTDGDPATEPVDPTRTGYTFDGWYDAATGGTVWDFTDPITGDVTLYAQWTQNAAAHTGDDDDTPGDDTNGNLSDETLPDIGSPVPPLMVLFALLLICGGALVLVRSRRIEA